MEAYDGNPYTEQLTGGIGKVKDLSQRFNLLKQFKCVMSLDYKKVPGSPNTDQLVNASEKPDVNYLNYESRVPEDNPLQKLLDYPGPRFTARQFRAKFAVDYLGYGNAFFVMERPSENRPIRSSSQGETMPALPQLRWRLQLLHLILKLT